MKKIPLILTLKAYNLPKWSYINGVRHGGIQQRSLQKHWLFRGLEAIPAKRVVAQKKWSMVELGLRNAKQSISAFYRIAGVLMRWAGDYVVKKGIDIIKKFGLLYNKGYIYG